MVTEREERQAGSAFPLGARTAARRLLRNHHVAEMLTTPMSPAAKDCQVCNDSVSDRAACFAVAPTESSATTHLQALEHRWESGTALPYSTLTELERHWLRNARRAVCNTSNVCSRCTGHISEKFLSWACCGTCETVSKRQLVTQCNACNLTLCIPCRVAYC